MISLTKLSTLVATAGLGLAVSACAILSSPDPVQTYRFGGQPAFAMTDVPPNCEAVVVAIRRIEFTDASRSDRLLSVTGSETAYIGGARWVSQAESLFRSSLEDGFAQGAPCVRLAPGAFARDNLVLSVDVRRFETVYESAGSVPYIHISAVASLIRPGDRSIVADTRVDISQRAEANRVSAIVAAYDEANVQAVREIVNWTATEAVQASRQSD